jgi:hypothetical protein
MLEEFLRKAIHIDSDEIEIEARDGKESITAFKDVFEVRIGIVAASGRESLHTELEALLKEKKITIDGKTYSLQIRKFESFGEWVCRIKLKETGSDQSGCIL